MKHFILIILVIVVLTLFTSCSERSNITTETTDKFDITYVYTIGSDDLVSKRVYDKQSKITTEYTYHFEHNSWGTDYIGVSVIITSSDGTIIDKYEKSIY